MRGDSEGTAVLSEVAFDVAKRFWSSSAACVYSLITLRSAEEMFF